jgi:hypothetical protein
MSTLIFVVYRKYYNGDQIKEDEMDETCSTHGGYENAYKMFIEK